MLEKAPDLRGAVKIVDIEALVPQNHLLRKIDYVIQFDEIYNMVEQLYSADKGRPAADPVVLVKMALIQHLYGIRSMRQTVQDIEVNVAYRWFLHFALDTPIPHFATVSYAFATRFPSEVFEKIFAWILDEACRRGFVQAETIFIDGTHIKANANKQKLRKEMAQKTARVYDEQLRSEIEADRSAHGKKPLRDNDDDTKSNGNGGEREITVSTTDPECGLFHKGEHKVVFAYNPNVACDENNFVLDLTVAPGNSNDSTTFDAVYDSVTNKFPDVKTIAVDAGYKTPWICKKVMDDGRNVSTAYKRPMTKRDYFKNFEYPYDKAYDCILCPQNQVLSYSTTNRDGYREYKSDPQICASCPCRNRCTQSRDCRKIVQRHIWADYVDRADDFRHSLPGKETYARRKETIERVFGDAKEKYGMRYTQYRGLTRVSNWVRLKFAAMNLKKIAVWAC